MWPEVISRGQMIRGWWNSLSGRDKIAVAMEVTIAAAATIYAGISLCHLSALRESNRISREALIAVQRAYVSLKTIEAVGTRDAQGKVISWQFFP